MQRRENPHGQDILSGLVDCIGDIKCAAYEGAVDMAQAFAVHPDFGEVVDSVKLQPEPLLSLCPFCRNRQFGPVPPHMATQGFGNLEIIQCNGRLGKNFLLHQRRQHGSGDGSIIPAGCIQTCLGDTGGTCGGPVFAGHFPAAIQQQDAVFGVSRCGFGLDFGFAAKLPAVARRTLGITCAEDLQFVDSDTAFGIGPFVNSYTHKSGLGRFQMNPFTAAGAYGRGVNLFPVPAIRRQKNRIVLSIGRDLLAAEQG